MMCVGVCVSLHIVFVVRVLDVMRCRLLIQERRRSQQAEVMTSARGHTHTHTFTDTLHSNMKLISRLGSRTYAGAAV